MNDRLVPSSLPVLNAKNLDEARPVLLRVCYRMLGNLSDAEDAVQETLLRAWRSRERFEGRAAVTTWLSRIAVRVCLDVHGKRKRSLPPWRGPAGTVHDELHLGPSESFVEPLPHGWAGITEDHPERRAIGRETIRLAYAVALQHLPPRQRAALILTEVVGLPAQEVAAVLETSTAAVNSALQRARRTLADVSPEPTPTLGPEAAATLEAFVRHFEAYDLVALATLLRDDTTMCMPPYTLWLRGADAVVAWMGGRGAGCRGSILVPTHANGAPAFAQYRVDPAGGYRAWALVVPVVEGATIGALHFFLDTDALFPRCGLALTLPAR